MKIWNNFSSGTTSKALISIIDEMRRPASSTEYREISNQMRAHHEVGPKEETGMGKDITTVGASRSHRTSSSCGINNPQREEAPVERYIGIERPDTSLTL
jgi:hypothetical protein